MARRHQHSVATGARWVLSFDYVALRFVQRGRPLLLPWGVVVDWGHGYHGGFVRGVDVHVSGSLTIRLVQLVVRLTGNVIDYPLVEFQQFHLLLGFELNAAIDARMDAEKQLETFIMKHVLTLALTLFAAVAVAKPSFGKMEDHRRRDRPHQKRGDH